MTKNDTRAARGAALFVLGGLAAPAFATTYVVDTLADVSAADGQLSLREAVMAASTNAAVGDAPAGEATGDSISFASALSGGTIALTASLPSISDDLALAGDVTISGESAFQIFSIDAAGEPRFCLRLIFVLCSSNKEAKPHSLHRDGTRIVVGVNVLSAR